MNNCGNVYVAFFVEESSGPEDCCVGVFSSLGMALTHLGKDTRLTEQIQLLSAEGTYETGCIYEVPYLDDQGVSYICRFWVDEYIVNVPPDLLEEAVDLKVQGNA